MLLALGGVGITVSADTWDYGYTLGGAYSNYYHESKTHSATVVNRNTGATSKDTKTAGAWARASIGLPLIGGQASFYYNIL
ncbi:MAG: lactococcin 972 family bacteriocin [Streptococcaceae bacterium]|nr:lactococcin 972 family bacteriocin [Streptococcaceae bacterium]